MSEKSLNIFRTALRIPHNANYVVSAKVRKVERQDLKGKRFGRLTVLEETQRRNYRHYWLCRCDCGNEKVVEESHLKSGHTKSCGCYRTEKPRERRLDLTGQRYGRLTVLGPAGESAGGQYWDCLCDCGKRCSCHKERLRSGLTKSCGCLQDEQRRKNMADAIHFVEGTCLERITCSKKASNNTSGFRGVYRRENGRWRAAIGFQGKVYNLGTFSEMEDAIKARKEAEERLYQPLLKKYREKVMGNLEPEGKSLE